MSDDDVVDDLLVERVLRCVEQVPAGRVVSYGDVGRIVGMGPRQVGAVLARWGSGVAWWRVTSQAGELPSPLLTRAREHWAAEGIGMAASGRGCRIAAHRADRDELARAWALAVADLPQPGSEAARGGLA